MNWQTNQSYFLEAEQLRAGLGNGDDAKIQYSSLGTQVYELLWKRIVSQQLQPGDKLSDLHLSKDLGVSRTPVREALYRLVQDGIVQTQSNRGFYLATFSSQDVQEIYDVRTALEVLAVRLAFPNLSQEALEKARQDLDLARRLIEKGEEKGSELFLQADRDFHRLVITNANNRRLASSLDSLKAQIGVFQVYGNHLKPMVELSIRHHENILNALLNHDREGAEKAMEQHIQEVKIHLLDELANGLHLPKPAPARKSQARSGHN